MTSQLFLELIRHESDRVLKIHKENIRGISNTKFLIFRIFSCENLSHVLEWSKSDCPRTCFSSSRFLKSSQRCSRLEAIVPKEFAERADEQTDVLHKKRDDDEDRELEV